MMPEGDLPTNDEDMELARQAAEESAAKDKALIEALADKFGIEADDITAYAFVFEHVAGDRLSLSTMTSTASPWWRLEGMVRYLLSYILLNKQ